MNHCCRVWQLCSKFPELIFDSVLILGLLGVGSLALMLTLLNVPIFV